MTKSQQQQDQINRIEHKKDLIIKKQLILFAWAVLNDSELLVMDFKQISKRIIASDYEIQIQVQPINDLINKYTLIATKLNVIVRAHSFSINIG